MRPRTVLGAAVGELIEGCVLTALVLVPVFFNISSQRVFDEDKIPFLRSLSVVIVAAWLVWGIDDGWMAMRAGLRRLWRTPLAKPALLLAAIYVVATITSIAPRISWLGAYERRQGTYTWFSYAVVFWAIVGFIRRREQVERAVTAMVLASIGPALYAIVQHLGRDPIDWSFDVVDRAFGTFGNPIFLSSFLIMVVPLTLARLVVGDQPHHGRRAIYLMLLTLQVLAILCSKSRGPFLGLTVGTALWVVLVAARHRRRWLIASLVGLVAIGTTCLIGLQLGRFAVASARATGESKVHSVARIGRVLTDTGSSANVRILIWQGVAELLASDPMRLLIGYGPETLQLTFGRVLPLQLAALQDQTSPDRAHNETFDALVTTGVAGCIVELALFVGGLAYGLRRLGYLGTGVQQRRFIGVIAAGGLIGGAVPYLIHHEFTFSGLGVPAGMTVGLFGYLIANVLSTRQPAPRRQTEELLVIGLLAALMGHFIELQFGIATASTRLYFWVILGLIVVSARPASPPAVDDGTTLTAPRSSPLGLMVGVILASFTFNFFAHTPSLADDQSAIPWLLTAVWLVSVSLVAAESPAPSRMRQALQPMVLSLCVWLPFALVYIRWQHVSIGDLTSGQVDAATTRAANAIGLFYVTVLLSIVAAVVMMLRRDRTRANFARRPLRAASLALPLAVGAVAVIVWTNLDASRADTFSKQASVFDQRGHGAAAYFAYGEAVRLQPAQDFYATDLGRFLMIVATGTSSDAPKRRDEYLQRAHFEFERARALNPLQPDHSRNLARLHRVWAGLVDDASEQARHVEAADHWYDETAQLAPRDASSLNEWAGLYIDRDQPNAAFPLVARALTIGTAPALSYALRAQANIELGQPEEALADSERASRIDPDLILAVRSKALALARLGRLDPAIDEQRRALVEKPGDANCHRDLALLYEASGQRDLALAEAQTALTLADPANTDPLRRLRDGLRQSAGAGAPN